MGDGPEQQAVKPRPPVRAHDDEVGTLLFSQLYQLFGRPPHKNDARGIHPGELFRQEGVQDFWMVSLGCSLHSAGC